MPQQLRVARGGMFAQAILALLGVLGVWLWAGSAMSARLAGELAFTALPAALGLGLCRLMWRQGVWIPRLVLALQVWWAWGALGWLADGSWRGITQLVLPVLIGVYLTRPAVREWFALPARERAQRPQRRPLLPFSVPHFIGWRRDRGQTATEYIGLLTVVAAIIGALLASGVTTEIGQSVAAKICRAVGTTCGTDSGDAPQAGDGPDQGGNPDGDQGSGGNEGTPQGEPGRERNADGGDPQRQPGSKQEPAPEKEQEEQDEGCFSGFTALVSCGGDSVKDVGQGIEDAGGGIKDKFTGDYIDGPKELAKGLWNDPVGTAKGAVNGVIDQATKPFQDARQTCDAAGGGALGTTTCVLGWGNAVVNYPTMLITSQVADDDVKESIQKGELPRAGGQLLYNGATVALPFLKSGKILKTIGKSGKKTKPETNGKNDQADDTRDNTRNACRIHSFLPGTPVLLANGSRKPIEQIRIGEKVIATDPVSELTAARTVTDTITTEDDKHFTRLTVRTGVDLSAITATDTHPFWSTDQHRWIDAGNIHPGAKLRTPNGSQLTATETYAFTKQQRTHDLTIAGIHTYYIGVGRAGALVHNNDGDCGIGDDDRLTDDKFNELDDKYGPEVADGTDYQVHRMRDGSAQAADHDIPGVGGDPDDIASYLNKWRGKATHRDAEKNSSVAYDDAKGVIIVDNGYNVHAYKYPRDKFYDSERYKKK